MSGSNVIVRRVRVRGLAEGKVQKGQVDGHDNYSREGVERFQEYGFAANGGDGEGLVIEVDGHTILIAMDRLGDRPALGGGEVCMWHRAGHRVTLKDSGLVQVDCKRLVINAEEEVQFNTPMVKMDHKLEVAESIKAPMVEGTDDVKFGGKSGIGHVHSNVQNGPGNSGAAV
jgi:phage gp45-like